MKQSDRPKILEDLKPIEVATDTVIFRSGDDCQYFYYVISGKVRVDLLTATGKPVTLYRILAGESCILSTACLFSGESYYAEAVVEETLHVIAVPKPKFDRLCQTSDQFRSWVFNGMSLRLSELMAKIADLSSVPVEQRLAQLLLARVDDNNEVIATQEQLAQELGTAREVISRQLSKWRTSQIIEVGRGRLRVLSDEALASLKHLV